MNPIKYRSAGRRIRSAGRVLAIAATVLSAFALVPATTPAAYAESASAVAEQGGWVNKGTYWWRTCRSMQLDYIAEGREAKCEWRPPLKPDYFELWVLY